MKSMSNKNAPGADAHANHKRVAPNTAIGALALLLALSGWSATAPGGVSTTSHADSTLEKVEPAEELQRPPGNDELPTSQNKSMRNKANSVIKCWQYGRLILNENDWKLAGPVAHGGQLYSSSGRYSRLQLMPFGETFCTLKQGVR